MAGVGSGAWNTQWLDAPAPGAARPRGLVTEKADSLLSLALCKLLQHGAQVFFGEVGGVLRLIAA